MARRHDETWMIFLLALIFFLATGFFFMRYTDAIDKCKKAGHDQAYCVELMK